MPGRGCRARCSRRPARAYPVPPSILFIPLATTINLCRKTVSVAILTELVSGNPWGSLMAGSLLGSLPVAIFYSFFVDYYV
jgi:ABC-type glycerol-3-phosphate transport system permease component